MTSRRDQVWADPTAYRQSRPRAARRELPCHVWAQLETDSPWSPALLVRWEQAADGTWLGEVAIVGASGLPVLATIPVARLRPTQGQ